MKSYYIETFGCSSNQSHSEVMEGILAGNGFRPASKLEKADVIVINSCIVKTPTENRIRERIRFIRKKYPEKKLVITGCAADADIFRKIAPNAIFISSHDSGRIADFILKRKTKKGKRVRRNPFVGIVEISSGCLGNCSYCIVRHARGALKSKPIDDVVNDVRNSLGDGCNEIWITSQDNSCYGRDIGSDLTLLLEKVISVKGNYRVRIGMMNPHHLTPYLDRLMKIYKDPKIFKFAHIPVQSGSDKILRLMNRKYSVEDFEKIVGNFRDAIEDIALSTDIIVGFPGETEEDFEKTLDLIERIRPDVVNVSRFGARVGTRASEMTPLHPGVVKNRSTRLAELARRIGFEKNRDWIGRECKVFFNDRGSKKNQYVGRNESYKPVIVENKASLLGKTLKVKITGAGLAYLSA